MIHKMVFLLGFAIIFASSCKKSYNCVCKHEFGEYIAGETEGTKRQAKKYCASLSSGSTTCDIG